MDYAHKLASGEFGILSPMTLNATLARNGAIFQSVLLNIYIVLQMRIVPIRGTTCM